MYGAMRTYLLYLKVYTKETSLPTIGTIHKNALKKSNKTLRLDKQEYISIPSSFLAFLAGLIDGDGYIQISKTPKGFITMKLVISLHLEDISTLEYIHSVLKLDQFNLAMYILRNDIKLQSEISEVKNVPFVFEIPKRGLYTDEPHCGDVMLKILLNAGTSPILGFAYDLFLLFLTIICVKIAMTWRQSAGVRSIHTSEASQRLHAEDLTYAYLVGLFEGDGFFSITKKGKYLTYELGIELSIKDVQLIYKIKALLGIGVVSFRKRNEVEMVSLRIRDKKHLKNFILPIFDKYPMFSNKQYDYLRFRSALLSGIIYSEDLPEYTRSNAEGCFSIYKLKKDNDYLVASFDIAQKDGDILIKAISKYLSFTTTVYLDKYDCSRLKVTSI
ncbi:unnamed protein product [Fusarium graminearum]|nr:unnamed protein product [Fusarium graminearum]CAF3568063.1 unnamed protein product [Fusarium graminearum]